MTRNLRQDEDDPAAPRRQLDAVLEVSAWRVPGGGKTPRQKLREAGAPDWWYGDEDASQSFLASVGAVVG